MKRHSRRILFPRIFSARSSPRACAWRSSRVASANRTGPTSSSSPECSRLDPFVLAVMTPRRARRGEEWPPRAVGAVWLPCSFRMRTYIVPTSSTVRPGQRGARLVRRGMIASFAAGRVVLGLVSILRVQGGVERRSVRRSAGGCWRPSSLSAAPGSTSGRAPPPNSWDAITSPGHLAQGLRRRLADRLAQPEAIVASAAQWPADGRYLVLSTIPIESPRGLDRSALRQRLDAPRLTSASGRRR